MQTFFIFVSCQRGQTYAVGRAILRDVPGVREVSSISGKWDLLIKIVVDSREDVGELINDKLAAIEGIRRTKTVVAYCASGGRSAMVGKTLQDMGYTKVMNLGGFKGWVDGGGPIEKV